ncbi:MAG: dihydroflavonol 4-reductase, partial [Bacteroidetes bacterium HGW-Bacteroidetes-23]
DRKPKSSAEIIYKNDLAKKDLNMSFRPVLETLTQ